MDREELAEVQRAIAQRLDDFRRAGLTHWKRVDLDLLSTLPATAASKTPPASNAGGASSSVATKSGTSVGTTVGRGLPESRSMPIVPARQVSPMPPAKSSSNSTSKPAADSSRADPAPVPASRFEPLNLPREDRIVRLKVLADQVKGCTRCRELAETRTQTVFGVGNPEAKIVFVGEAPGADEDKQGEPFVGRAGQLLNDIIKACRMKREDIYICNVLRCRPPGNRLPSPEEASNCREYLDGQLSIVNPDYIVCWGSTAARNLLASDAPIGKMRGKFYEYGRAKVLCTYHPSYLLRNPAAKKDVWEDMKLLFLDMGVDLSAKP